MRFKWILFLTVMLGSFTLSEYQAQNELFSQKKERKKIWRRWRKNREAYNPYLNRKAKNKPSAKMNKANQRELRKQKRLAKKQMKRSKRSIAN